MQYIYITDIGAYKCLWFKGIQNISKTICAHHLYSMWWKCSRALVSHINVFISITNKYL